MLSSVLTCGYACGFANMCLVVACGYHTSHHLLVTTDRGGARARGTGLERGAGAHIRGAWAMARRGLTGDRRRPSRENNLFSLKG